MREKPNYYVLKDNGTVLWTDRIEAESESDAIEKANFAFHQLTQSEKEKMKSFLLFEGYDECDICGGFYEDDDSEGAWIIEKEIIDFVK